MVYARGVFYRLSSFVSISIYELLQRLEDHSVGCHIGNEYYGTLCYADDPTLLCPTMYGLQYMVNVCEMFGREHCVTFNVAKSYSISYGPSIPPNHNIHMNGNPIKWLNEVNHLGNHIKK